MNQSIFAPSMKLTLLVVVLSASNLFAQNATIDITGVARLDHQPTQCVVTFQIMRQSASYESALKMLNTEITTLTNTLKKQGFSSEEIITQQFEIVKNRSWSDGKWKEDGYNANQSLNVTFPIDQGRLIKVLDASTSSGAKPEVTIAFEIDSKTREKLVDELIQMAVRDAKKKATLIAETAGYVITGIEAITYGFPNRLPEPRSNYKMMENSLAADASFGPMVAESIQLSDQVQVRFLINTK